ncbi:hypothetical protein NL676_001053 [Syzygium grande]|nr:hypothetical protein NL676_001053 [Syzygium grande]
MFTSWSLCSFVFLLLLPFFSGIVYALVYNTTAGLSTKWIASAPDSPLQRYLFPVEHILLSGHNGSGTAFTCGFYYPPHQKVGYFGIFIARAWDLVVGPAVVWSANRNNPVSANATLELTAEGDLVLTNVDGSAAWSTHTIGMSVSGMNLTETGNLVLFDKNNATVWQSFDHPTDSLVLGQKLTPGTSSTNWTEQGILSLSLTTIGLFAQTETDPPQVYYSVPIDFPNTSDDSNGIEFIKGCLALFINSPTNGSSLFGLDTSAQYVKFESDGHLRS